MTLRIGYDACLVRQHGFGVDRCVFQLVQSMVNGSEHEFVVYGRDIPVLQADETNHRPSLVSHVALPDYVRLRPLRILWQQAAIPARASSDGIDLFHATYTMPLALKIPTVLTIFDCLALEHPHLCGPATRWHYRVMLPLSIRRASQVIVPSSVVRRELLARFSLGVDQIVVIPPGIDDRFRLVPTKLELDVVTKRYELPDSFVLFVGHLEPKKNVDALVMAFQEARRAGLEGELVIVGGSPTRPHTNRHQRASGVHYLGYVPDEDLPALYRLASEVAFPSLAEGFGLPVLEAMAGGAVVVASPVPSVLDSDPNAVVVVDPLSPSSICKALLHARNDSGLRSRLKALGPEVARKFSWARAAERTLEVYQLAIKNAGRV